MIAKEYLIKKADIDNSENNNSVLPYAAATATGLGVGGWNAYRYGKTIEPYNIQKHIKDLNGGSIRNAHQDVKDYAKKNNILLKNVENEVKPKVGFNRLNKYLALGGLGTAMYTGYKTIDNFSKQRKSNIVYN